MAKTILIVEDDELNMKLMNDLLRAKGYETIQTKNGGDALPLVREHRPDLVIMDIQLPGISGLDATRAIKAEADLKHIPVVAVTAFALRGDEEKMRRGGCDDYIAKPISISTFLGKISELVG